MKFNIIDFDKWDRRDCFNHFISIAQSTYSITVNIDISKLLEFTKINNYKFYPVFTWIVTKAINNHIEFKMSYDEDGRLGYYDYIFPDYAVIDDKTKIMDSLSTPFNNDFKEYYNNMICDMMDYKNEGKHIRRFSNFFVVSCMPWINYSSFCVMNESDNHFLFPMVTWGKYINEKASGKFIMPLTLQVHHAVADGYHCSLFYDDINKMVKNPNMYLS